MGVFGWDYPPGCSSVPGDEPAWCEVCGGNVDNDECICPECPECGEVGNPECYTPKGPVLDPSTQAEAEQKGCGLEKSKAQVLIATLRAEALKSSGKTEADGYLDSELEDALARAEKAAVLVYDSTTETKTYRIPAEDWARLVNAGTQKFGKKEVCEDEC